MTAWAKAWKKRAYRAFIVGGVLSLLAAPLFQTAPGAAQSSGTTYTVQSGENLFRIALRYNLTVEVLAAANGITDPTRIYAGQVLIIPGPDFSAPAPPADTAPPDSVAVAVAPADTTAQAAPVYHTVQAGETLASIGRLYNVNWSDIATLNGLSDPNHIYSGQQLLIPGAVAPGAAAVPPAESQAVAAAPQAAPAGTESTHVVQAGETLASIARAYNISWPTIARANGITDPNHIFSGQTLTIPATDDGLGTYLQPDTATSYLPPAPTTNSGKEIIVDLSDQRYYAYENGQLVRTSLVSTGLSDFPTVQGNYSIYSKYTSQLMSGPGYYLPGVPYVMYFYQGYSLHGTYWHSNFGHPMSHGCVNLPTSEAEWLFYWADIGTPVHVES